MHDATSYRVIAPYYDWVMHFIDYRTWGEYLLEILKYHGIRPRSILEMGAGTCPFGRLRIFPADARVVYSDLSPYMLQHGALAAPDVPMTRAAANVLALPFKSGFELCIMVSDALNYLMTEKDVLNCFREAHRVLAPGGHFLFDASLELNSLNHWKGFTESEEREDCTYVRHCKYDQENHVQHDSFTFFIKRDNGHWLRIQENHLQRNYTIARLMSLARKAGFTVEGAYGDFTYETAGPETERVTFLVRKKRP